MRQRPYPELHKKCLVGDMVKNMAALRKELRVAMYVLVDTNCEIFDCSYGKVIGKVLVTDLNEFYIDLLACDDEGMLVTDKIPAGFNIKAHGRMRAFDYGAFFDAPTRRWRIAETPLSDIPLYTGMNYHTKAFELALNELCATLN